MDVQLMNQRRHEQLIKTAAEVIELMNIGVDGADALTKFAKEHTLNKHEVELVAHAINNSRQLAHLQTSKGEDREKAFSLVDADQVQNKLQPATNAAQSTGDRYGKQDEASETANHRAEQPDAVGIKTRVSKEASYLESASYFPAPEKPDHEGTLREGWGLQGALPKLASYVSTTPLADTTAYRAGVEEARVIAARAWLGCEALLDKIAGEVRRTDAGPFARVAKLASAQGVCEELLDIVWDHTGLATEDYVAGAIVKQAHEAPAFTPTAREQRLCGLCVELDALWKQAADATAAEQVLRQRFAAAEEAVVRPQGVRAPKLAGFFDMDSKVDAPVKSPDAPPKEAPKIIDADLAIPQWQRQELKGYETRVRLENLLGDDYISGFPVPEVIEAYNEAIGLNPHFSEAEMRSYIRQHLASQGAVPLDLQVRTRAKDYETTDEDGIRSSVGSGGR